jgi:hypothetical protein
MFPYVHYFMSLFDAHLLFSYTKASSIQNEENSCKSSPWCDPLHKNTQQMFNNKRSLKNPT